LATSSEGGEQTFYYAGDTLRAVVERSYYEMGRVLTAYFLVDRANFVVLRDEYDYDRPITEKGRQVSDSVNREYFFCGGVLASGDADTVLAGTLKAHLDSALANR